MITIYQLILNDADIHEFNTEGTGKAKLKFDMMLGKNPKPADFKHYTLTMEVASFSIDEAFELTNLWRQPERVRKYSMKTPSTSVGDVFQDGDKYYLCCACGWEEFEPFATEEQ